LISVKPFKLGPCDRNPMTDACFSSSPIDRMEVSTALVARVVAPGAEPRIHGYGVQDDLAVHATFAEVVLTALAGEVPGRQQGRAFEIAMVFACPISIADAPSHAAALARICGAEPAGVLATGAIGLSEEARFIVEQWAATFEWLDGALAGAPASLLAEEPAQLAVLGRLRSALEAAGVQVPALDHSLAPWPALIAVFHHCGLRQPHLVATALAVARWPIVAAEAFANRAGDFAGYPINLPAFDYEHRRTDHGER
jgi:hypothetical protein